MNVRRACIGAALAVSLGAQPAAAVSQQEIALTPGAHQAVVFDRYPAIATASNIARRFLSPIATEILRRRLLESSAVLREETFDSRTERFFVYVPRNRPTAGYGLLVFVPPWPEAQLPPGWNRILDKYGLIFVSPMRSGNDENVLERRLPLALAALSGIQDRLPIDPARRLIGGFSGGSRVAMRIALDYPDLFSGALLNAGSDPIGQAPVQLPAPDLLLSFQTHTRLAYATGALDEPHLSMDSASIDSMRHWCVENINVRNDRGMGHDPASPGALDWAIQTLLKDPQKVSDKLSCRVARKKEIGDALTAVEAAIGRGQFADARRMLNEIDRTYGALALPQSITLADRCSCGILEKPADRPRRPEGFDRLPHGSVRSFE